MPSIFSRVIDGELPGRFVWKDDSTVAMIDIRPLAPGHVLVIPRLEVDHWVDLDANLAAHLMRVARAVGRAQMAVFAPARIGLILAGYEVPHAHIHVVPTTSMAQLDFANANTAPDAAALDDHQLRLRDALQADGHDEALFD